MPSPDPTLGLIYVCYCTGARTSVPVAGPRVPDLVGFVNKLMDCWPEGDVDGGDLQEWALQFGILRKVTRQEPCCEGCVCAESYDDPPYECNERVPLPEAPVIIPCPVCDQPMQPETHMETRR